MGETVKQLYVWLSTTEVIESNLTCEEINNDPYLLPATIVIIVAISLMLFIVTTTICIRSIRTGRPARVLSKFILVGVSASCMISYVTLLITVHSSLDLPDVYDDVVSAVLHFLILNSFLWSLSALIGQHFLTCVMVGINFEATRWKMLIACSVLPLPPITIALSVNIYFYRCTCPLGWMSSITAIYSLLGQCSIVVVVTTALFIYSIYRVNVTAWKTQQGIHTRNKIFRKTTRLFSVSCIQAINWVLVSQIPRHGTLFYYLFSLSALINSFLLMRIYLNRLTKDYWKGVWEKNKRTVIK